MRLNMLALLLCLALFIAALAFALGCSSSEHSEELRVAEKPPNQTAAIERDPGLQADVTLPVTEITTAQVHRVGGDLQVVSSHSGDVWSCGPCTITTPLPIGYPAPTPPEAIELKKYPSVRRAEYSGSIAADIGMNFAFFPLFNHIKRRGIAMTSPVEVDYQESKAAGATALDGWTMSFLYRQPDMGTLGKDGSVMVVDAAPTTVVSIGVRGASRLSKIRQVTGELRDWLTAHPEWEAAGQPRALFYNGPEVAARNAWGELQIPVVRRPSPAPEH